MFHVKKNIFILIYTYQCKCICVNTLKNLDAYTSSQGHLRLRASTEPMRISWKGARSIPEYRVSCIEHSEDLEDETTLHM